MRSEMQIWVKVLSSLVGKLANYVWFTLLGVFTGLALLGIFYVVAYFLRFFISRDTIVSVFSLFGVIPSPNANDIGLYVFVVFCITFFIMFIVCIIAKIRETYREEKSHE
ncbi:MAG: hypothetical protein FWF46_08925 [Oscillospiraceae bacterium]|nr:hypothetical protein [Oscillospiraceae bacterium]